MATYPQHLQEQIGFGNEYLVLSGKQAWMAASGAVFLPEAGKDGHGSLVAIHIPTVWTKLEKLAGDSVKFTRKQLAAASGMTTATIDTWIIRGLLTPETDPRTNWKRFSFIDLFVAALAGTLRRSEVPMDIVTLACGYVRNGANPELATQ